MVELGEPLRLAAEPDQCCGLRSRDDLRARRDDGFRQLRRGGRITRATGRAGGIEGGMSTGQPIRVRAAMQPFSSVPKPLATVDLSSGEDAVAIKQRTDVCAVPAGGVVGEAVVAFELANATLEKFGGDSLPETRRNLEAFVETLP